MTGKTTAMIDYLIQERRKLACAISVIGFLVAGIAGFIKGDWTDAVMGIGVALLTGSFLYIWFDLTQFSREQKTTGCTRTVYANRTALEAECQRYEKLTADARLEFVAMGTALDSLLTEGEGAIRNLLNRGTRCKLLLESVDSEFLEYRAVEQGEERNTLKIRRRNVEPRLEALLREYGTVNAENKLELRCFKKMPIHSMFIIDQRKLLIMPYVHGKRQAPWLEILQDSILFDPYYSSFKKVWDTATPLEVVTRSRE